MTNGGWTPERRLKQSQRASRYWSSPEGQRRRAELRAAANGRWQRFADRWPERADLVAKVRAAISAGETIPMLCDRDCGRTGAPVYDWDRLELVGWRCYECRKPSVTVTPNNVTVTVESQQEDVRGDEPETVTPLREGVLGLSRSLVTPLSPQSSADVEPPE